MIFSSQLEHAWKVVNLLVRLHFCNSFRQNASICPEYIPIVCVTWILTNVVIVLIHLVRFLILVTNLEIEKTLSYKLNNKVLGIAHINDQAFLVFELWVVFVIFNSHRFSESLHLGVISFLLLFLWLRLSGC